MTLERLIRLLIVVTATTILIGILYFLKYMTEGF
jgi:hypothetical protein